MVKKLFLILLFQAIFITAFAQDKADSTAKAPTDTSIRKQADSIVQQHPADTLVKKSATDSTIKTASPKHTVDSVVSHTDSTAKQEPVKHHTSAVVKRPHADSAAKVQSAKNDKPAPAENVLKHSTVKTLSDEQYNILLKGEDFDHMALAGEMNHYPSPDNALKHKVELGLNPGQLTRLKDISNALRRKKIEMGENIIKNEKMLDTLFQTKQAADGTVIFYTNRYGLYIGEIRNAVLQACLKTREVLSEAQIKKLEGLNK